MIAVLAAALALAATPNAQLPPPTPKHTGTGKQACSVLAGCPVSKSGTHRRTIACPGLAGRVVVACMSSRPRTQRKHPA